MSACKFSKCKCLSKRFISNGVANQGHCLDICTDPICGDPDFLTLFAPVVYDELGINLCRSIPLATVPAGTERISVQVTEITPVGTETSAVPIPGRTNCYLVTLSNLSVTFYITFYDAFGRVSGTTSISAIYLPSDPTSPDYAYLDDDTNPSSVELEIYAPYGIAHDSTAETTGLINMVGLGSDNTTLNQGLNLLAYPKVLNYSLEDGLITIGLSLILKSVYFSQYRIPHNGKAVVPKACTRPDEDTLCMDFVCGDLLDLAIKPLELGFPKFEEHLKNDCSVCTDCCSTSIPVTPDPSSEG